MAEHKYKVQYRWDDEWEVVKIVYLQDYDSDLEEHYVEYRGSLPDCEVWIRLKEGGYML